MPTGCAAWCCPSCSAAISTTACSIRCARCTGRSANSRRAAAPGRPERANDVKLSRGGIREIEFTVQLLQVVRGGQFPELRTRPTLDALQRLARANLMPQETADALAQAYEFLRRVEHRIQYLDDQQTHVLPVADDDLRWIAQTMGYADCCPFLAQLDTHREFVAQEFDKLLGGEKPCNGKCNGKKAAAPADLATCSTTCPPFCRAHPRLVRARRACWPCAKRRAARLRQLVQRTGQWLKEPDGDGRGADAAPRGCRAALGRLDRAADAPRELPGAAGRAARRAGAPAAAAGRREMAGALSDAASGRDRRTGERRDAVRPLRGRPNSSASSKRATPRSPAPARPTKSAC
jgi:hypothetical protein